MFGPITTESAKRLGLTLFKLPGYPQAQSLLDSALVRAYGQSEPARMSIARELWADWQAQRLPPEVLPFDIARGDDWYFVQLLSQRLHVTRDGFPLLTPFEIGTSLEILLEDFPETDYDHADAENLFQPSGLIERLFAALRAKRLSLKCADAAAPTRMLCRDDADTLIAAGEEEVLHELALSQQDFALVHAPYDCYIRLFTQGFGQHRLYTHFFGYRIKSDLITSGLIGGSAAFGGAKFVDSLWPHLASRALVMRLAIAPRTRLRHDRCRSTGPHLIL